MWACNRCGQEHETLHDARWNCPCREDPEAVRAYHVRLIGGALRVALALALGGGIGALRTFNLPAVPLLDGLMLGAQVGLVVGVLWGTLAALSPPAPPKAGA
jgi:hypothetical protein